MLKKEDFKRLNREEIYQGHVIKVVRDELVMPNGKKSYWDLIDHNGAAAVIPVDEEGNILMVHQFRNAADDITIEIPAGGLEIDEDPVECAKRELEEETGYIAGEIEYLLKFYTSIGFCNEVIYVYVAKALKPSQQNLDEDEFVTLKKYALDQLITMIFEGVITDNKTISALLAYKHQYNL